MRPTRKLHEEKLAVSRENTLEERDKVFNALQNYSPYSKLDEL